MVLCRSISLALLLSPAAIVAGNGMYMISYGARYAGFAGAATALGGSVMDVHANPSLVGSGGTLLEGGLRANQARMEYQDRFLDSDPALSYTNKKAEAMNAPLPYFGFVSPLGGGSLRAGGSVYLLGGGGGEFNDIVRNTPRGNSVYEFAGHPVLVGGSGKQIRENVFARMMHARMSGAVAYQWKDWYVGVSFAGAFGRIEMRHTFSDPTGAYELPGQGLRYKSEPATALSGTVGIAYNLNSLVRLGYTYSAPTVFHMDGSMSVNAGDPRFYHKSGVSMRMVWPEQHRAGIAFHRGPITVSWDVGHIRWTSMRTIKFVLEDPFIETPFGFYSNTLVLNLHPRDQSLTAFGLEYAISEGLFLRAGYNYARTNVSSEGVNPLFSVLTEHHMAVGLGLEQTDYSFDFALEYAFPHRVSGGNTSNWDIGHAIFNARDFRVFQFDHSKRMQAVALIAGVRCRLGEQGVRSL